MSGREKERERSGGYDGLLCVFVCAFVSCVPVLSIQQKSTSLKKKVKMVKVCYLASCLHATLRACSSRAADEANLPQ